MVSMFLALTLVAAPGQAALPTALEGAPTRLTPPSHAPTPTETEKWRPPFVAHVHGPEAPRPGDSIQIRVEVERLLLDETPMRITVGLPQGVTLERGTLKAVVVDNTSPTIVRTFDLRLGTNLPSEDVTVTVEQRGEAWAANATKRYRFGRPDPQALHAPLERGEPIDLGNGVVVRPVKIR